VLPATA